MTESRRFFLGVDGGQTSTQAVLGDDSGKILTSATGGPCQHISGQDRQEKFRKTIQGLLDDTFEAAGLSRESVLQAACFGMSGGPDDKRRLLEEITPSDKVLVTTDAEVALAGATNGGAGIIVIAGTGSIGYGRDENGNSVRCGGWGYVIGDEGGSFDIVRRSLRKALAAEEGWGQPTSLLKVLLLATGAQSANELLHQFYTPLWPHERVAQLTKRIAVAADDGDEAALEILSEAGTLLANIGKRIAGMLSKRVNSNLMVYPCGGVFGNEHVLNAFKRSLNSKYLLVSKPAHNPAQGALLLAYRASRLNVEIKGV